MQRSDVLAVIAVVAVGLGAVMVAQRNRGSPLEAFVTGAGNGVNLNVALEITKAYERVLKRTPTEAEIVEYHVRMLNDSQFDVSALETSLRETGEYRRLQSLQSNSANPGLEGTLTDAQVLSKLRDLYRGKVGVDPDEATLTFLMERYRKTRLDDDYIKSLIDSITMAGELRAQAVAAGAARLASLQAATAGGSVMRTGAAEGSKAWTAGTGTGTAGTASASSASVPSGPATATANEADFMRSVNGRESDSLSSLCKKLGVSPEAAAAGPLSADALLGGRCPGLSDVPPDMLSQKMEQRNMDGTPSPVCRAARYAVSQGLSRAGYVIPPEQLGSWTVPQKSPPICIGGDGVWGPVNDQTALIGTPIAAAKEMEGRYDDLVLM